MTRPNFFLAGVQKGGTSTLHLWLQQHPSVFLTARKELHYFCRCPDPGLQAADSDAEYAAHFVAARPGKSVIGESSPCYVYYPEAIAEICRRFPEVRFLVSLRDPVERFWSHYLMNRIYRPQVGEDARAILDRYERGQAVPNALDDLVGVSQYSRQVENLFGRAGAGRVLVLFLEEMAVAPSEVVDSMLEFLELDPAEIDTSERDKVYVEPRNALGRLTLRNPTVRRIGVALIPPRQRHRLRTRWLGDADRKPQLDEDLRARLQALLRADSIRLEEILGRKVPWEWHRG